MAKQNLTKSTVDNLAPSDEDYVIWDSALPGFGIRVKPSNVKSYIVQYRNRKTGASRRKTIGQHGPLLTFHKAKERARIILADALKGNDPVADDRAIREAPTMRHLALDYLEQHAIPKKRPRSVENDRSMINRIILPRLGSKKVAAVQSRDIHLLHASMKSTPYQANRVLALLSKMLSLASKWGWRSDNPVKGIERFQEKRRERWLSDDELSRLLAVLAAHQNQRAANAVRFQLLTGARLGESDLKTYRQHPTPQRKAALRARFDRIFTRKTGFVTLDRLLARLHANKHELLMVLDRPEIPLHTNGSENDVRCQVTKRKVSGGTRSDTGRDCRDAFLGLSKTCAKLGFAFWDYLGSRLAVPNQPEVPYLPAIVRHRCATA